jgi:SSS family solute:Na+ symporter
MAAGSLTAIGFMVFVDVYANEAIYYSLGASFVTYVVVSLATPATDPAVLANWDRRVAGDATEEELVNA